MTPSSDSAWETTTHTASYPNLICGLGQCDLVDASNGILQCVICGRLEGLDESSASVSTAVPITRWQEGDQLVLGEHSTAVPSVHEGGPVIAEPSPAYTGCSGTGAGDDETGQRSNSQVLHGDKAPDARRPQSLGSTDAAWTELAQALRERDRGR
jgi:hypothetical protein